jgi:[ribosomal protein S18]-alanine N-acetyltransferase
MTEQTLGEPSKEPSLDTLVQAWPNPVRQRLTLRTLTADLLPAVVELDRRCFGQLWTLDGYQRELDSPNSDLIVLLADPLPEVDHASSVEFPLAPTRDAGKNLLSTAPPIAPQLIGLGCYWAILEEAHITIVAIDPAYQNQGLGQLMLNQLLVSAHHRGLAHATLEVRASNVAAIALYQKFGFQIAGQRKRYYADTGEDALVLWLNGLQQPQFYPRLALGDQHLRDRLVNQGWQVS